MATKRNLKVAVADMLPGPSLSVERKVLAETISRRDELQRRHVAAVAAAESTMRESWDLDAQLEAAREEIPKAERRDITSRVNAKMSRAAEPGPTLAEAKSALANLEEQVEICDRTRKMLDAEVAAISQKLENATNAVKCEIYNVVAASPEFLQMLNDLHTAIETHYALWEAVREIAVPRHLEYLVCLPNQPDQATRNRWQAARTALETDATAPLPS
jgi:chromosome segregation ATPase